MYTTPKRQRELPYNSEGLSLGNGDMSDFIFFIFSNISVMDMYYFCKENVINMVIIKTVAT